MQKLLMLALIGALMVPSGGALAAPDRAKQAYQENCDNVLEGLRIVRPEQFGAVGHGDTVVIHPICRGVSMSTFGNADGLARSIAANRQLSAALARNNWRADDVVGIRFGGGNSVHLYVHRG